MCDNETNEDKNDILSFEEYCISILDITYYNFLSKEEWENCYEKYEKYLDNLPDEDNY